MTTRAVAVEDLAPEKRRKIGNGELRLAASPLVQITTEEDTRSQFAAFGSLSSDHITVSCCSSIGSTTELQFTDLEESIETRTLARYNLDTGASKSTIELKAASGLPETTTSKPSTFSRRTVPPEKIPPADELEEFFASAEKHLHKRFKEKYNYDIVNDTPLEGRFEWIQLKP